MTSAFDRQIPARIPAETRAEVCNSQDAVSIGTAWTSALRAEVDASALAAELRQAAAAAPEPIRADFHRLVDAQVPFLAAVQRAKESGNYAGLTQDPEFQRALQRLADPAIASATANINIWFAQHCPKPG